MVLLAKDVQSAARIVLEELAVPAKTASLIMEATVLAALLHALLVILLQQAALGAYHQLLSLAQLAFSAQSPVQHANLLIQLPA